jgi:transposase
VGAHTTLKERQLVINHFNSGNSLRETTDIIQRSHSTDRHIVERYRKGNRLTGTMRKSINKFTACEERWILRQIRNNRKLSATKLAAEIKNLLHKQVNPVTVRRLLRKNYFHVGVAR